VILSKEVIFQILWLIIFCVTLWGMLTHHEIIPSWVHQNDKVMHFLTFGLLAGMAYGAWPGLPLPTLWLLMCILGVMAEGAQHFTQGHRFCWRDAVANAMGAGCALLLLHWSI
jgi:hypothetical protein